MVDKNKVVYNLVNTVLERFVKGSGHYKENKDMIHEELNKFFLSNALGKEVTGHLCLACQILYFYELLFNEKTVKDLKDFRGKK